MNQYPPQQPGYPYSYSQPPVKRKVPVWTVCLILLVCVVGGIYGFLSIRSASGNPYIGESYSDFVDKYGSPQIGYGGAPEFYADSARTILLLPSGKPGTVPPMTQDSEVYILSIHGPYTWTLDQTVTYCKQFLPSDATVYTDPHITIVVGGITFYRSRVGIIDIQMNGPGACDLSIQTLP